MTQTNLQNRFLPLFLVLATFAVSSSADGRQANSSSQQSTALTAATISEKTVDLTPYYGSLVSMRGMVVSIEDRVTGGAIILGRPGGQVSVRIPRHVAEPDFPPFGTGEDILVTGVLLEAGEDGSLPRLAVAQPDRVVAAPTVLERVDWRSSGYGLAAAALLLFLLLLAWRRLMIVRERPFRSAFDQAGGAMIITDGNLKLIEANRAACRLLQKSHTQLKFKQLPQLVKVADNCDPKAVVASLKRGDRSTIEAVVDGKEGAVDLDMTFSRVRAGRKEYTVALLHDVSRHTDNVTQFKNFHETLLDGIPVEVGILSPAGKYLYANGLGFDIEDARNWVVGKTDLDLCRRLGYSPDVALRRRAHRRRAISTQSPVKYEEVLSTEGLDRHVLRTYHPVFEETGGEVAAVASYGVDITELKNSLQALDEARSEADSVGRLKESFLENINEEFRAPITSIIGFAEILSGEVPDAQREFVNLIERNGRRLMNTLNAVLDLAGLNNNEFSLSPQVVNVVDEVKIVADSLKGVIQEKGLFLRVESSRPEILCRADQACLARVVQNLVDNAVKFTEAGGVVVEVESDERWVNVRVLDSGTGLEARRGRELLTGVSGEPLRDSGFADGAGFGLGITKRLVELMHGRIEVESELDEGSVISVRIPRAFPRRGRYGSGLPRVLVAEASSDSRTMISYVLDSRLNVQMVPDTDGLELEMRRIAYDMILIDTSMGSQQKLSEYVGQIRSRYKEHHVPIVAVDNKADQRRADEFEAAGFDAYLAKPFKKHKLVSSISEILFQATMRQSRDNGDVYPRRKSA